jgi:D-glycero-alpha-D-manno-heptose-7-phosphate kinase
MILTRAPLRITLGGGGTDLPSYYSRHGGFVLSAAINKYVYICINRPAADDLIRVKYSRYEQVATVAEIQHDLVRPALAALDVRDNVEIVSMADVPDGTGLGSSSSYLVALLTALYELKRERVATQALAETAVHIEMDLAGHAVGKQDHYLASFGGLTCLDIAPDGRVTVSPLRCSVSDVEELHRSLLLFFTGLQRSSREILHQQVEDTTREDRAVLDSLHRTKEIGLRVKEVLERGNIDKFGQLLDEHWQIKKRRSDKISDSRIDGWYELARRQGAWGGKVIGAGGGGFLMVCCPPSAKAAVREALAGQGLREMAFDFDTAGAKLLVNF